MTPEVRWAALGWRHPIWDLVRYYLSLKGTHAQASWLEDLKNTNEMTVGDSAALPIDPSHVKVFFEYLKQREQDFARMYSMLRLEEEAVKYCSDRQIEIEYVKTKSKAHHQSPKAVVALVNWIATRVCKANGTPFDSNPQTRCVWCAQQRLHVSARRIDGAIPALANPTIIWENKEYWGGSGGGSKMSDAVYECNLVGRELREFEEQTKQKVVHIVFVDGSIQWGTRKSDLNRFIDLTNQGLIDHLLAGREIETQLEELLTSLLAAGKKGIPAPVQGREPHQAPSPESPAPPQPPKAT